MVTKMVIKKCAAVSAFAKNILPPFMYSALKHLRVGLDNIYYRKVLTSNTKFCNKHAGERCFIVGNGPSLLKQNLDFLQHEVVFSVSSGYRNDFYSRVCPQYHVTPHVTFVAGGNSQDDIVAWFREMERHVCAKEIFFSVKQFNLIRSNSLFNKHSINYIGSSTNNFRYESDFDLTKCIPQVQSVPVLTIVIAIYMGFKDIYLIGVDHDWFIKREYKYAFGKNFLAGKELGVEIDGSMPGLLLADELPKANALFDQYRRVKEYGFEKGVSIYNATAGGLLDEFPRVSIEEICTLDI